MSHPLVTVVCLCYNHERFVAEAIRSVLTQSYENIQLIVADDASTDNSVAVIREALAAHPQVETLFLPQNLGNCKAFNRALPRVKGEYVIDFAADDVMTPDRIEKQVNFFSTLESSYGVVFTNALYIDEQGKIMRDHYLYLFNKALLQTIPQGDVYPQVIARYFIASPTMMVRMSVMRALNGYDEALTYEDFDFWVRSSREYKYAFLNERLTRIRRSARSMSTGWYKPGDKQLHSTYLVCKKIAVLNRTEEERKALLTRLHYELRQSVFSTNREEAKLFYSMLKEMHANTLIDRLLVFLNRFHLPLWIVRDLYHKLRYG
jgi:glycosyltransferase involved in cell wall biosynthesis